MKEYYDRRAPEYDDAYLGTGMWADGGAEGVKEDVEKTQQFVASLRPAVTLDVACGTGFLTRYLRGPVVGLDHSRSMLRVARTKRLSCPLVQGDALALPFGADAFERVFSSHFYGRLEPGARARFLAEARRVAPEVVILDTPWRPDGPREGWEERRLLDGTSYWIYKRYFTPDELSEELGGGRVLYSSEWFVAVEDKR